jgi:hypothetical protein
MAKSIEQINFDLRELCKYQQGIIERYKEYIEKHIVAKILEEDSTDISGPFSSQASFKRITIPQSTFMLRCEPYLLREWNVLKYETPLISPEYFMNIAYKEQEETKDVNAN